MLHAVERVAIPLSHLIDRHNPWVVELGRRLGLATKPTDVGSAGEIPTQQHFDGHGPTEALLGGLVDHPHTAAADLLDQLVLTERRRER